MTAKFAKFVEWATDSKYVPLGSHCSLCDKKLGFFRTGFWSINAGKLADGVLCEKCKGKVERLLATRCEWMKTGEGQKAAWERFGIRNMHRMPLHTAQAIIAAKEEADQGRLATFGSGKTSLFRVEAALQIEPNALQVGVARARRLKNKAVVFGTVERGSFSKNTHVQLEQSTGMLSCAVLEAYVYDCEENTLEVCLRANMGKHRLRAGERGWRVLDMETALEEGAIIVG